MTGICILTIQKLSPWHLHSKGQHYAKDIRISSTIPAIYCAWEDGGRGQAGSSCVIFGRSEMNLLINLFISRLDQNLEVVIVKIKTSWVDLSIDSRLNQPNFVIE